jgi:hypothetical protein
MGHTRVARVCARRHHKGRAKGFVWAGVPHAHVGLCGCGELAMAEEHSCCIGPWYF